MGNVRMCCHVSNTGTLDTYYGKVKKSYTGKTCPTCADIVDVIWSVVGIQRGRPCVHRHPGPSVQHHWWLLEDGLGTAVTCHHHADGGQWSLSGTTNHQTQCVNVTTFVLCKSENTHIFHKTWYKCNAIIPYHHAVSRGLNVIMQSIILWFFKSSK